MAQTQPQQFSSQSFSPPMSSPSPGAGSPVNGGIPPPPKRARLSPHAQSPYTSPSLGTLHLPQQHNSPTANGDGSGPNGSHPTQPPPPPPPQVAGSMGPPSRPVDKTTDAAELTDVLASTGIDVREEEAFLTSSYSAPGVQAQQPVRAAQTQLPPLNTSFASQTSTVETFSARSSFAPSQQKAPVSDQIESATTQTPAPLIKKEDDERHKMDTQAARRSQHHLQEPFLLTKVLEQKLQKRGLELGVRIPSDGLYHPVPGRSQPIQVTGPDGSSVVRTGQTLLSQDGVPLVDILNLMSLSCEERLRSVLDYSMTLARSRRAHSHGFVPAEWSDVAQPKHKRG